MKRLLSTALVVVVLLALGALAVLARSGSNILAPGDSLAAAQPQTAAAPHAPAATSYNVIALPLDAESQFPTGKYNAEGLATVVGPGVQQVLEWNPSTGSYLSYIPGLGGDTIPMKVGGVYWLELSNANSVVSFVGNVPTSGSPQFTLVRPSSGACIYNDISIPLSRSDLTTPQKLADSIGNVEQVLQWNPVTKSFLQYVPGLGGDDIVVKIGYPYHVCLLSGGATTWPSP
jgi:hypothetical protein